MIAAEAELNEEEEDDDPEDLATLANMGMNAAERTGARRWKNPSELRRRFRSQRELPSTA